MNRQSIKAALLAAGATALVGAAAITAHAQPASPPAPSMPAPNAAGNDMPMHRGMMGSDHPTGGGSMMGMMGQCRQMMGGGMAGGAAGFSLPPGNEKLEAQMRAEMLQKTGEIAAKYADRIKEAR